LNEAVSTTPVTAAPIAEFDITSVARSFHFLRAADYCLVFLCGLWGGDSLLSGLIILAGFVPGESTADYFLDALIWWAGAYIGLKNFGRINHRRIMGYVVALPWMLLAVLGALFVELETVAAGAFVSIILCKVVAACSIILGWGAAVRLSIVRLRPTDVRLFQVLRVLRQRIIPFGNNYSKPPAINRRLGLAVGAFAIALLIVGFGLRIVPQAMGFSQELLQVFSLVVPFVGIPIQIAGLALIVRSRRYFQTQADELLKVDLRQPIVFLRSFEEEEVEREVRRVTWSLGRFLDYSVEARLYRHFQEYGPFIAIGSPRDNVPQIGAARMKLPDDQWQDVVTTWMQAANVIVMFAGMTNWLSWELMKVAEGEHAEKLLLIFRKGVSVLSAGYGATRFAEEKDNSAARFEAVRDAFYHTKWSPALAKIEKTDTLCAIAFHSAGSLTVVRCELTTNDSYHLGALVGHFRMLTAQPGSSQPHVCVS
jgi:hypothetical protein